MFAVVWLDLVGFLICSLGYHCLALCFIVIDMVRPVFDLQEMLVEGKTHIFCVLNVPDIVQKLGHTAGTKSHNAGTLQNFTVDGEFV